MSSLSQPAVPPPYPPRRDPRLQPDLGALERYRDMGYALDFAEFPQHPYPNLDNEDKRVYRRARQVLLDRQPMNRNGQQYRNTRSVGDRRSRARLTLRALKQVSEGVRGKFQTTRSCFIKPGQL